MTWKLEHIHAEVTRHCLLETYEVPPLSLGNSQTKSLYIKKKSEKPGVCKNIYIMVYRESRLGVCMESWIWRKEICQNIWFTHEKREVRPRADILASMKLSILDM